MITVSCARVWPGHLGKGWMWMWWCERDTWRLPCQESRPALDASKLWYQYVRQHRSCSMPAEPSTNPTRRSGTVGQMLLRYMHHTAASFISVYGTAFGFDETNRSLAVCRQAGLIAMAQAAAKLKLCHNHRVHCNDSAEWGWHLQSPTGNSRSNQSLSCRRMDRLIWARLGFHCIVARRQVYKCCSGCV
jgi:hypothetical protein